MPPHPLIRLAPGFASVLLLGCRNGRESIGKIIALAPYGDQLDSSGQGKGVEICNYLVMYDQTVTNIETAAAFLYAAWLSWW